MLPSHSQFLMKRGTVSETPMANPNETEGGKSPRAQAKRNVLDRLAQLRNEGKLPDSEAALDSIVDKIIDQEVKTVPGIQKQGAKKDITRIYLREKPHFVKDIEDYKARIGMAQQNPPSESSVPIHPPSREHPLVAAFQTEMGEMYEAKNPDDTKDVDLYAFSIKQGDLSSEGQIDAILKKYTSQIAACPSRERDAVEDMLSQERAQQIKKLDEYVAQHDSEDLEKTIIISPTTLVPTPEPGSSLKPMRDADVATHIFNHMRTERKTNLLDEEVIKYMTDYFEVHPELKEEFKDKNPNNPPGMDQKRFNRLFRRLHLNQVYYERKGSRNAPTTPAPAQLSIPDVIAPGDYKNEKTDSQIFTDAEKVQKDIEAERQRQKLPTAFFPISSESTASSANPESKSPDQNDTQLIPLVDDAESLQHPKLIFDESQLTESNDSGVANKTEALNRGATQEEGSEQKEGVVSNQQGATPMNNSPSISARFNEQAQPILDEFQSGRITHQLFAQQITELYSACVILAGEKSESAGIKAQLARDYRMFQGVTETPQISLPAAPESPVAPETKKSYFAHYLAAAALAVGGVLGIVTYNLNDKANNLNDDLNAEKKARIADVQAEHNARIADVQTLTDKNITLEAMVSGVNKELSETNNKLNTYITKELPAEFAARDKAHDDRIIALTAQFDKTIADRKTATDAEAQKLDVQAKEIADKLAIEIKNREATATAVANLENNAKALQSQLNDAAKARDVFKADLEKTINAVNDYKALVVKENTEQNNTYAAALKAQQDTFTKSTDELTNRYTDLAGKYVKLQKEFDDFKNSQKPIEPKVEPKVETPIEPIKPVEPVKPVDPVVLKDLEQATNAYLGAIYSNDLAKAKDIWTSSLDKEYGTSIVPSAFSNAVYAPFESNVIAAKDGAQRIVQYSLISKRITDNVQNKSMTAEDAHNLTGSALKELLEPKEGN